MNCLLLLIKFNKMVVRTSQNISTDSYQSAIEALNNLQSNATYLKNASRHTNTLKDTEKYLKRSGITIKDLKKLSIIHVAGTKGKGSTCAFTESILRYHGHKTGLYTSPHLVSVRERIRINGQSISEELFSEEFWRLHTRLSSQKDHERDMPPYFRFLTILMFHVFLKASVDVAIIEVGIGGLYDCTNIIPSAVCVGITRLDLDHTALLGDTISAIAAQKAGIFKKSVPAFSVAQPAEAAEVLRTRASAICCPLTFVPGTSSVFKVLPVLGISSDVQQANAALAIELARTWMDNRRGTIGYFEVGTVEQALKSCRWPGRTQILKTKSVDFYLDGAHTPESIKCCAEWFLKFREPMEPSVLIFNSTGNRDSWNHLEILRNIGFSLAIFVPNFAGFASNEQENRLLPVNEQTKRCKIHYDLWVAQNNSSACAESVPARNNYSACAETFPEQRAQVLVTGSLHLVGAALAILDPELTMKSNW
ncbi:GSCOCG00009202001-RA-CDS [Cotesia congregata]|nr:GSCOCG00009202001-RA-CDS [Cotesia congregata]